MASVSSSTARNSCRSNCVRQRTSKAAELPQDPSDPNEYHDPRYSLSKVTTQSTPTNAIDWDAIDPVTGLSNEYKMAMDIIDSCDYAELHRFNAPLLADRTMSIRRQIELYYNGGGESDEHRRKRKVKTTMTTTGKRKSVAEKVAAIVVFWRGAKVKKGGMRA